MESIKNLLITAEALAKDSQSILKALRKHNSGLEIKDSSSLSTIAVDVRRLGWLWNSLGVDIIRRDEKD